MHGHMEKKKEEQKLLDEEKKKPLVSKSINISMSEGPMGIKQETEQHERERVLKPGKRFDVQLLDESSPIQESARKQYEKSVDIEIAELKGRLARKKKGKKGAASNKLRYGHKQDDDPDPLGGSSDESDDEKGEDDADTDDEGGGKVNKDKDE